GQHHQTHAEPGQVVGRDALREAVNQGAQSPVAEGLLPKGAVPRPELGWAVGAHGSAPSLTKADLSHYQAVRRPRNGSVHEDSWAPHPHRTRIRPKKQKQAPDEVKKQASQRGGD